MSGWTFEAIISSSQTIVEGNTPPNIGRQHFDLALLFHLNGHAKRAGGDTPSIPAFIVHDQGHQLWLQILFS